MAWLRDHPEFLHGTIRIAFTTDEEVGRGTEHFDVAAFGADYAYTLDGSDLGEIEDETFCADTAVVTITGHDVHPGYAKDKLVNAVRVAAAIVGGLDASRLPETTEGRQPYLHPYTICGQRLGASSSSCWSAPSPSRSSPSARTPAEGDRRRRAGSFPAAKIELEIQESYRNMAYKIREDIKVLDYALEAVRRIGVEPKRQAIRGGTDGARLSFMGLLTPNVWAGGQSFHSVRGVGVAGVDGEGRRGDARDPDGVGGALREGIESRSARLRGCPSSA